MAWVGVLVVGAHLSDRELELNPGHSTDCRTPMLHCAAAQEGRAYDRGGEGDGNPRHSAGSERPKRGDGSAADPGATTCIGSWA
jgi:hypothetical protein